MRVGLHGLQRILDNLTVAKMTHLRATEDKIRLFPFNKQMLCNWIEELTDQRCIRSHFPSPAIARSTSLSDNPAECFLHQDEPILLYAIGINRQLDGRRTPMPVGMSVNTSISVEVSRQPIARWINRLLSILPVR